MSGALLPRDVLGLSEPDVAEAASFWRSNVDDDVTRFFLEQSGIDVEYGEDLGRFGERMAVVDRQRVHWIFRDRVRRWLDSVIGDSERVLDLFGGYSAVGVPLALSGRIQSLTVVNSPRHFIGPRMKALCDFLELGDRVKPVLYDVQRDSLPALPGVPFDRVLLVATGLIKDEPHLRTGVDTDLSLPELMDGLRDHTPRVTYAASIQPTPSRLHRRFNDWIAAVEDEGDWAVEHRRWDAAENLAAVSFERV
jgi:hypothetical protein